MYPRQDPSEALRRLAAAQSGVVTREQALGLGLGKAAQLRLVGSDGWQRLAPGVFFTAPTAPPWLASAWAGVLIGGDQARLGGTSAAHLHGLVAAEPPEITVLVPWEGAAPRVAGPWRFSRERPGVRLARTVGAPPRLGVEDTVLDLVNAPDTDVRAVVGIVTDALQSRLTTTPRLQAALDGRRLLRHRRVLSDLLADTAAGVRSPLELRYLRSVERAHGLPTGDRQQSRRHTEVDVWYAEQGLLVELDGRFGHEGKGRFRDMRRDNASTVDGLATLRYGHADVFGQPCEVAFEVAGVLIQRGWIGLPTRCPRCMRVPWPVLG